MAEGPRSKQVSGVIDAARIPTLDLTKLSTVGANEGDVPTIVGGVPTWQSPTGGGGPPSVDTWGAASRYGASAMTGDLALTDADDTVQFLDAGGADRVVTLPTPSTSSKFFLLVNVGGSGSIAVSAGSASALVTLGVHEACWCVTDGSNWTVHTFASTMLQGVSAGVQVFEFRGNAAGSTNRYLLPNGGQASDITSDTADSYNNQIPAVRAGMINRALIVVGLPTTNVNYHIVKDGVDSETLTVTSPTAVPSGQPSTYYKEFTPSTAVSAGSTIGVRVGNIFSADGGAKAVLVSESTGRGFTIRWAGSTGAGSNSAYLAWADTSTSTQSSVGPGTRVNLPIACTLSNLAWVSQSATSTTQVQVYKNGVLAETITLTGASGATASGGTSFAMGDDVSLYRPQGGVGTSPGQVRFEAEFTGDDLELVGWAGTTSGTNRYFRPFSHLDGGDSGADRDNIHYSQGTCVLVAVSRWGGDSGEGLSILKNGVEVDTTGTTTDEAGAASGTVFSPLDELTVFSATAQSARVVVTTALRRAFA